MLIPVLAALYRVGGQELDQSTYIQGNEARRLPLTVDQTETLGRNASATPSDTSVVGWLQSGRLTHNNRREAGELSADGG